MKVWVARCEELIEKYKKYTKSDIDLLEKARKFNMLLEELKNLLREYED